MLANLNLISIFAFCSENGRWQTAISSPVPTPLCMHAYVHTLCIRILYVPPPTSLTPSLICSHCKDHSPAVHQGLQVCHEQEKQAPYNSVQSVWEGRTPPERLVRTYSMVVFKWSIVCTYSTYITLHMYVHTCNSCILSAPSVN